MARLNQEEQELLNSFERGEWRSVEGREAEFERYGEYARATFKKDRRVNIRISHKDLEALQKRALEEGIPYQTLLASILHKYAAGRLVEKDA
jgi:predicted DNA binding CopG/RHH family protein